MKCLLSRPFPAGTWALLESRAEASWCQVWSTSCQPSTLYSTAMLFSCVDEEGERRAAQDLSGYLLLCFDFSYRSSGFSLMAFSFVLRDFFLGLSCRRPICLCSLSFVVTSCLRNFAKAAVLFPFHTPVCSTGHRPPFFGLRCSFLWFTRWGTKWMATLVSNVPTWGPQKGFKEREEHWTCPRQTVPA